MERLTVSQLAGACKVHIETVRYYEKRGLIPEPSRGNNGYRVYTHATVKDIQFIKRAQEIGFTLEEIKRLLSIYKNEKSIPAEEMQQYAVEKIQEIKARINQLLQFKILLESVGNRPISSGTHPVESCPVIQKCSGEEDGYNGREN
ncbi:MerR family transcriptional regulator [Paenibacillus sp. NPDC057967]|uniref:MerR family transcriptional regulator n=1 Tax=Paenibacillus sp. NPDC057967 TaxID=3346293 RepID=UPI0036DD83A3